LPVKRVLGYKNIKNTLIYLHLIDLQEDEWLSKIARNAEACELVEAGIGFVCFTPNTLMVFRIHNLAGGLDAVRGMGFKPSTSGDISSVSFSIVPPSENITRRQRRPADRQTNPPPVQAVQ